MKLCVVYRPAIVASASPYRVVDDQGQEITWTNDFLDAQRIRQLSLRSLRAYAYDLLHFARWWLQRAPQPLLDMNESTLLDYVRDQLGQQSRLGRLYRCVKGSPHPNKYEPQGKSV